MDLDRDAQGRRQYRRAGQTAAHHEGGGGRLRCALDGVTDGVLDDPRRCTFDPAHRCACRGVGDASCLTPPELDAVKKVYAGARTARTGTRTFSGWPLGSEGYR